MAIQVKKTVKTVRAQSVPAATATQASQAAPAVARPPQTGKRKKAGASPLVAFIFAILTLGIVIAILTLQWKERTHFFFEGKPAFPSWIVNPPTIQVEEGRPLVYPPMDEDRKGDPNFGAKDLPEEDEAGDALPGAETLEV